MESGKRTPPPYDHHEVEHPEYYKSHHYAIDHSWSVAQDHEPVKTCCHRHEEKEEVSYHDVESMDRISSWGKAVVTPHDATNFRDCYPENTDSYNREDYVWE